MQDGKYVVLCVDDDPDIINWMHTVLEAQGYVVADACSAEEGLERVNEVDPDLIIVDLMMEEIDSGTDFVKELKAAGRKVPIYMLSSAGKELNMTTDYSSLGLDGVFQKPLDPKLLLKILAEKLK
jgi:two-component system chemotaxis response regulator CheY